MIKKWLSAIIQNDSKILILGTFPSENSLKDDFYYTDSRNSFWEIIWNVFWDKDLKDKTNDEKRSFLIKNNIALWDIFRKVKRINWSSTDNNTNWLEYNNIKWEMKEYNNIKYIIVHSKDAETHLKRYIKTYLKEENLNFNYRIVSSPSNNNTHKTKKEKIEEWKEVFKEIWIF